jgi:hypothetical protein
LESGKLSQKIIFKFPNHEPTIESFQKIISSYTIQGYHKTAIPLPTIPDHSIIEKNTTGMFDAKGVFNYYSSTYQRITQGSSLFALPNFYIEFENEKNEEYAYLKALDAKRINKNFFMNLKHSQDSLISRIDKDLNLFSDIFIGNYNDTRDYGYIRDFPHYCEVVLGLMDQDILMKYTEEINFQEQFLNLILNRTTQEERYYISENEGPASFSSQSLLVSNLESVLGGTSYALDSSNNIVFENKRASKSDMVNGFKKRLLKNFIDRKSLSLIKDYKQIRENHDCPVEHLYIKIKKYSGSPEGKPDQTYYYPANRDIYRLLDTQVFLDRNYIYKACVVSVVYGTQYEISDYNIIRNQSTIYAELNMIMKPSFKILEYDLIQSHVSIKPFKPLPPSITFFNKSNSKNEVGIYLDLKWGTQSLVPFSINNPEKDNPEEKFEYLTQQGIFQVYRIDYKPSSYRDFVNQKIMDIQNSFSSTSVSFKDYIKPNTEYYYTFTTKNSSNENSNPTPIYKVVLLKDADDSKIQVTLCDLREKKNYLNKTFRRLVEIRPAFNQSYFDPEANKVDQIDSFQGSLDKLSLGVSEEGIWGRKFKIRIKSKDSGKIIDFNVKFKLSTKKTEEDL